MMGVSLLVRRSRGPKIEQPKVTYRQYKLYGIDFYPRHKIKDPNKSHKRSHLGQQSEKGCHDVRGRGIFRKGSHEVSLKIVVSKKVSKRNKNKCCTITFHVFYSQINYAWRRMISAPLAASFSLLRVNFLHKLWPTQVTMEADVISGGMPTQVDANPVDA